MRIELPAVATMLVTVILGLTTIVLAGLKGFSIIHWNWWLVAAPIGIPTALAMATLAVMYPIAWIVEARHNRRTNLK